MLYIKPYVVCCIEYPVLYVIYNILYCMLYINIALYVVYVILYAFKLLLLCSVSAVILNYKPFTGRNGF